MSVLTGTSTITRPGVTQPRVDFDEELEEKRGDDGTDYSGWYCVQTAPFPCPAAGCDFVADYMTGGHRIIVYPRPDDPYLLAAAHNARLVGRDPRILEYQPPFGPCIPYDLWVGLGRPVHGKLPWPDGLERGHDKL